MLAEIMGLCGCIAAGICTCKKTLTIGATLSTNLVTSAIVKGCLCHMLTDGKCITTNWAGFMMAACRGVPRTDGFLL